MLVLDSTVHRDLDHKQPHNKGRAEHELAFKRWSVEGLMLICIYLITTVDLW